MQIKNRGNTGNINMLTPATDLGHWGRLSIARDRDSHFAPAHLTDKSVADVRKRRVIAIHNIHRALKPYERPERTTV